MPLVRMYDLVCDEGKLWWLFTTF